MKIFEQHSSEYINFLASMFDIEVARTNAINLAEPKVCGNITYNKSLVSTYKSNNVNWLGDRVFSFLQVPLSNSDKMGIFSN